MHIIIERYELTVPQCFPATLFGPINVASLFTNGLVCFAVLDNPDDAGGARVKRRRKPSEKGLELQAEKVKKPSTKPTSRLSKFKTQSHQDNSNGTYGDDNSDD